MKKKTALFLIVVLLLFTGCGQSKGNGRPDSTADQTGQGASVSDGDYAEVSDGSGELDPGNTQPQSDPDIWPDAETEANTEASGEHTAAFGTEETGNSEPETQENRPDSEESQTTSEESHTEEIAVNDRVKVTAPLNFRALPSTDSMIIMVLPAGAVLERTAIVGEWSCVTVEGAAGYVNNRYLTVTEEKPVIPRETPAVPETEQPGQEAADQNVPGPDGNGHTVAIDAGHQQHGISEKEPDGPGSNVMKAKLTTGTQGCVTGKPEYQLNLEVSLQLRSELEARGYRVVMIRETNDCPMSNAERAIFANESGADIFVRIHANGSENPNQHGVLTMAPTEANQYVAHLSAASIRLAQMIVDHFSAATGARNIGVLGSDDMSGINWSTIPVTILEMGYMSNPDEDSLMSDAAYQEKMVQGIADGIDAYFGQ